MPQENVELVRRVNDLFNAKEVEQALDLVGEDFDWATGHLMERAERFAGGRLVSLLEGGYDLQGLAFSVAAHVGRLMKG